MRPPYGLLEVEGRRSKAPRLAAGRMQGDGIPGTGWVACRVWPTRLLVVACVLFSVACGYRLVGTSSNLPASITSLCVTPFVNQTERAELDQRLAEALTQEWVRRGRFQLVSSPEQADAVLSGAILHAATVPVQFDEQGRAKEYQLTLVASVQLVDRTGEKPVTLWQDKRFTRTASYTVDASATDYFDRETEAIEQLARDYARGLVVTILEGF